MFDYDFSKRFHDFREEEYDEEEEYTVNPEVFLLKGVDDKYAHIRKTKITDSRYLYVIELGFFNKLMNFLKKHNYSINLNFEVLKLRPENPLKVVLFLEKLKSN